MRTNVPPTLEVVREIKSRLKREARQRKNRPRRKVFGAEISEDFGNTWKLRSLCDECVKSKNFEPPTMVRNTGESGTLTCGVCGAVNEMYKN